MENAKQNKFLGICMVIASVVLAIGMIVSGMMGRYNFYSNNSLLFVEDSLTGKVELYDIKGSGSMYKFKSVGEME